VGVSNEACRERDWFCEVGGASVVRRLGLEAFTSPSVDVSSESTKSIILTAEREERRGEEREGGREGEMERGKGLGGVAKSIDHTFWT
jgi:hypothetical protein